MDFILALTTLGLIIIIIEIIFINIVIIIIWTLGWDQEELGLVNWEYCQYWHIYIIIVKSLLW